MYWISANCLAKRNGYYLLTGGACFVAGTQVLTENGLENIESIEAGDMVWASNPYTGETGLKKVVRTYVRDADMLVHLHVGTDEIKATPEHPFYVPQKGWTAAIDLRAGDVLVLSNGEYVVVEKVQHEILETPVKVYNFEVQDFHTYFVGELSVLVHNTCGVTIPGKITGYTRHGLQSVMGHDGVGVNPSAILDTIKNPIKIRPMPNGTLRYVGEGSTVVLNQSGMVVTAWATGHEYYRIGR